MKFHLNRFFRFSISFIIFLSVLSGSYALSADSQVSYDNFFVGSLASETNISKASISFPAIEETLSVDYSIEKYQSVISSENLSSEDISGLSKAERTNVTTIDPALSSKQVSIFSDVSSNDWFYNDVKTLASSGIINGYPDGSFMPQGNITRAEFLKLLCGSMGYDYDASLSFDDTLSDQSGNPYWFSSTVSKALGKSILYKDEHDGNLYPNLNITRKEAAILIVRALSLPLNPYNSPYADANDFYLNSLYAEHIMQGSLDGQQNRYFFPDSYVTRAETSAIINRLISYRSNREAFISDMSEKLPSESLALITSPKSVEEFYRAILYSWRNNLPAITFSYPGISYDSNEMSVISENYKKGFELVSNHHPEYSNTLKTVFTKKGTPFSTTLKISFDTTSELDYSQVIENSKEAINTAKTIIPTIVNDNETDREKAEAIHDYLIENIAYSTDYDSLSNYTAYGALINGSAVCQGYASAFNLLCDLAGINSYAVSNDGHMWNAVIIEGEVLYYDATWDDPIPDNPDAVLKNHCGISLDALLSDRKWDSWDLDMKYFDF